MPWRTTPRTRRSCRTMWERGGATKENPRPYLKTVMCRVVSIAAVIRKQADDGRVALDLRSLPNDDAATATEADILSRFLTGVGKAKPQLVGFNSRSADLMILVQRAMVNRLDAAGVLPAGAEALGRHGLLRQGRLAHRLEGGARRLGQSDAQPPRARHVLRHSRARRSPTASRSSTSGSPATFAPSSSTTSATRSRRTCCGCAPRSWPDTSRPSSTSAKRSFSGNSWPRAAKRTGTSTCSSTSSTGRTCADSPAGWPDAAVRGCRAHAPP